MKKGSQHFKKRAFGADDVARPWEDTELEPGLRE